MKEPDIGVKDLPDEKMASPEKFLANMQNLPGFHNGSFAPLETAKSLIGLTEPQALSFLQSLKTEKEKGSE